MTDAQPPEKKRSKRIYIYWSVAFALLLALGLFSWCVLRPVLEVRRWLPGGEAGNQSAALEAIDELGGPQRAIAKLSLYLRFVARSYEEKRLICIHLGYCGPSATPALARALRDEDARVRREAASSLGEIGGPRAVEYLIAALRDENDDVRHVAVVNLGWLADSRAIGALEAIPADAPEHVRYAAVSALKEIRSRDRDYCLRLARSGKGLDEDNEIALVAIARFHVREGMSRSEVTKLLRGIGLSGFNGSNLSVVFNSLGVPSATFHFEKDRLVSWSLSCNYRTWYYPGEKYER